MTSRDPRIADNPGHHLSPFHYESELAGRNTEFARLEPGCLSDPDIILQHKLSFGGLLLLKMNNGGCLASILSVHLLSSLIFLVVAPGVYGAYPGSSTTPLRCLHLAVTGLSVFGLLRDKSGR